MLLPQNYLKKTLDILIVTLQGRHTVLVPGVRMTLANLSKRRPRTWLATQMSLRLFLHHARRFKLHPQRGVATVAATSEGPPAEGHLPSVATSSYMRRTREDALHTPGLRWVEDERTEGLMPGGRETRKMNMYQAVRDALGWGAFLACLYR